MVLNKGGNVKFKVTIQKSMIFEIKNLELKDKGEDEIREIVKNAVLNEVWPFKPDEIKVEKL
ncbi:MAG: hypothetical protein RMJ31_03125 [Nitrososphaerota archaeon]|nr:hypothetical protein [Nitrososphaerota archaeon]